MPGADYLENSLRCTLSYDCTWS